MEYLVILIMLMNSNNSITIYDFNKDSNLKKWNVVDDVVMGGRSSSTVSLNADGFGVFSGDVSLANNGGFSSVRHEFQKIKVNQDKKYESN